jgi:preprotein translocase subunit SecG
MVACAQSLFGRFRRFPGAPRIAMKNIHTYLTVAQIAVSVLLIVTILLQTRGTGLGNTFGGEGNVYRTKRGIEKVLFRSTIVFAVLFLGLALASIVAPQL